MRKLIHAVAGTGALLLGGRAAAGRIDATFHAVQALELVAGAVNITLLGLNMRGGIAVARGRPRRTAPEEGAPGRTLKAKAWTQPS